MSKTEKMSFLLPNFVRKKIEKKAKKSNEKSLIEKKAIYLKKEEKLIDNENDELEDKVNFIKPGTILSSIL